MFDYTGYKCISCGKDFTDDDDIVVCPDCGTPYHRDCYKREGKCINLTLHSTGTSWKAAAEAADQQKAGLETVKCRTCGSDIRATQYFCDKCGAPTEYFIKTKAEKGEIPYTEIHLGDKRRDNYETEGEGPFSAEPFLINFSDPLCGFNPAEEYGDGVTVKDLGDYVRTNTHYYLPKFKLMKDLRLKVSLNIAAMLFPEMYFANRKMPVLAFLILIIKTALSLPSMIMTYQSDEMKNYIDQTFAMFGMSPDDPSLLTVFLEKIAAFNTHTDAFQFAANFSSFANFFIVIVFTMFSNYFYYVNAKKKTAAIKKDAEASGQNVSAALKSAGGTSTGLLIAFIVLYFLSQYAAMAAIMFLV